MICIALSNTNVRYHQWITISSFFILADTNLNVLSFNFMQLSITFSLYCLLYLSPSLLENYLIPPPTDAIMLSILKRNIIFSKYVSEISTKLFTAKFVLKRMLAEKLSYQLLSPFGGSSFQMIFLP